jgi:hypothetical protein
MIQADRVLPQQKAGMSLVPERSLGNTLFIATPPNDGGEKRGENKENDTISGWCLFTCC